jgi:hypothetical protein
MLALDDDAGSGRAGVLVDQYGLVLLGFVIFDFLLNLLVGPVEMISKVGVNGNRRLGQLHGNHRGVVFAPLGGHVTLDRDFEVPWTGLERTMLALDDDAGSGRAGVLVDQYGLVLLGFVALHFLMDFLVHPTVMVAWHLFSPAK